MASDEEREHEFPFGTFSPGKTALPLLIFRCSRKVPAGMLHLLSNRIFRKLFVNGKQPTKHLKGL